MAKTKPDRICGDCIHIHACQSWTSGILDDTDARPCRNYETVEDSDAYYLGTLDGRVANDWISVHDMMPPIFQTVVTLRFDKGYLPDVGWWDGEGWHDFEFRFIDDVQYWIPIPEHIHND